MQNEDMLVQLLLESGQGRRQSFHTLYQQTSEKLFATAVYLLKDKSLAEEALQESFVHIWYKASEYQSQKGHPFAWLVTIVRNQCFDLLRHENRQSEKQKAVQNHQEILLDLDEEIPTELNALSSIELELLQNCLQALDSEHSQSLLMSYYFGYSHAEMVEKFQKPLGTVKSWVRRGMQSIRECMQQSTTRS